MTVDHMLTRASERAGARETRSRTPSTIAQKTDDESAIGPQGGGGVWGVGGGGGGGGGGGRGGWVFSTISSQKKLNFRRIGISFNDRSPTASEADGGALPSPYLLDSQWIGGEYKERSRKKMRT